LIPRVAVLTRAAAISAPPSSVGFESPRLDRWLWTVRIFKTRSLAAAACRAGNVSVGDATAKPARELQIGEQITVRLHGLRRIFAVRGSPASRVGPKLVAQYCEDLTPPAELAKRVTARAAAPLQRARGAGRPTKRERRQLDQLLSRD